ERAFDEVTVDDIAAAAGIGRRTFFRYFPSKNDLAWGDFDALLDSMRAQLAAVPPDAPTFDSLVSAVLAFNTYPEPELSSLRERMQLLLHVPALAAHSTLRYQGWRQVLADFVAERLGVTPDSLVPQTVAWAFLSACLAGYEAWLRSPDGPPTVQLAESLEVLRTICDL